MEPKGLGLVRELDRRLDWRMLLCLLPVVGLIHDGEEWLTLPAFSYQLAAKLPAPVAKLVPVTPTQFAVSVGLLFGLSVLVAGLAASAPHPGWRLLVFDILLAGRGLNGVSHLGQAVLFRGYTPGVITAVGVVWPYVFYVFGRLWRERRLSRTDLAWALGLGAALTLPIILAVLALGKWLG
jgi:hypothetical protein